MNKDDSLENLARQLRSQQYQKPSLSLVVPEPITDIQTIVYRGGQLVIQYTLAKRNTTLTVMEAPEDPETWSLMFMPPPEQTSVPKRYSALYAAACRARFQRDSFAFEIRMPSHKGKRLIEEFIQYSGSHTAR